MVISCVKKSMIYKRITFAKAGGSKTDGYVFFKISISPR